MDKCQKDKCCLECWHMLKIVPGTIPLKFGQNRVGNSGDIADMDKCQKGVLKESEGCVEII